MTKVDWQHGKITEAGLDRLRSAVGVRRPVASWNRTVTTEGIEHFALGIGDDNPLWWDDGYAAGSPWSGRIAPPCYLHSHLRGPKFDGGDESSVAAYLPGVFALVSGERWRWMRPVRPGEQIRAEAGLAEVNIDEGAFGGLTVTHVERTYLLAAGDEVVAELDHIAKRFERGEARSRGAYASRSLATWTAEDIALFEQQYDGEKRRGGDPRFADSVRAGDVLGPMLKGPLTLTNMIGFLLGVGSSNTPGNRMSHQFMQRHPGASLVHPDTGIPDTIEAAHWEPALAQASGLPGGYDYSRQRASWFSHLLTDWAGDHAFLQELEVRIRRPNILGDVTWLSGKVMAVEGDVAVIALSAVNQLDEITATGSAKVRLPVQNEARPEMP